jgi:rhodanese-related sulfurtransferase
MRESYKSLSEKAQKLVREVMPSELARMIAADRELLIVDVRERSEYGAVRIAGSLNVPRGILEAACEYGYAETVPALVEARARPVAVICRSGNRSALAAVVLQQIGYHSVVSVRLGVKGWNDSDLPLVDGVGAPVDGDAAMVLLQPPLTPDQRAPNAR